MRGALISLLKSYSALFFSYSHLLGLVLLLLTFMNPNMGFGGAVSVASAYLFARAIGFREDFLKLEHYIYNPLLVGLALGYLFKVELISAPFFAIAGVLTFLLTYSLSAVFYRYLSLPVLSLPFVITVSLLYLASAKFTNLFVVSLYPKFYLDLPLSLPVPVEGFFKALGAILFTPTVFGGMVVFLALLFVSRILAFLSVLGYVSGVLTHALLVGSLYQAVSDLSAFNYVLISMAVGGVLLIPSPRSYAFAVLSSAMAVPVVVGIKAFWEAYGIPAFAFPFNFTVLLVLYVLLLSGERHITRWYRGTPESTLDAYLTYNRRFPFTGREIHLPFSGKWTVWQAYDGPWTHRGPWRFAYDFVITDPEGRTYRGNGYSLTDYYAFGKPVLSPVEGSVVSVVDNLPDNPPGEADRINNWGNHVVIYDRRGFYVLIAHFKQGSLRVKVGDTVRVGSMLGLCGNSGYSPQPHIHVHVQASPKVGVPTLPFNFVSYRQGDLFRDLGLPSEGEAVEPVFPDRGMVRKFNLLIDQSIRFSVRERGKTYEFKAVVKMDPYGYFYLTDGRARLYFGILNSTFNFYGLWGDPSSPLRYLFFAVPKLPLLNEVGLRWEDHLPLSALPSPILRGGALFLASFKHDLFGISAELRFVSHNRLEGTVGIHGRRWPTSVTISDDFAFSEVRFGDVLLKRTAIGWEEDST